MEYTGVPGRLAGSEIHGFRTMEDLDVGNMMEEAKTRWLRSNEIYAILRNHKHFTVRYKPLNLPPSGTVLLFDRKVLRNFRKDGHNWKKKKDGKTVKEAHEHLKVGDEERIHVYYAHGEDNSAFVRRCYWLLEKSLEHIVLVHYRETKELQSSPPTAINSNSCSAAPHLSTSWPLSKVSDLAAHQAYYDHNRSHLERRDSITIKNHEQRLHEINTLEWDELLVPGDTHNLDVPQEGKTAVFESMNQSQRKSYGMSDGRLSTNVVSSENSADSFSEQVAGRISINHNIPSNLSNQTMGDGMNEHTGSVILEPVGLGGAGTVQNLGNDKLQQLDSFGRWVTSMIADSPESVNDQALDPTVLTGDQSFSQIISNHHTPPMEQIFNITDISPSWALSTEGTKILVVGVFNEVYLPHTESKLYLACGDSVLPLEAIQGGAFRCLIPPQSPGLVNFYMTFDGRKPISQVLSFEFRAPVLPQNPVPSEDRSNWEEFQLQMRLMHLLCSSSKSLSTYSSKLSPTALKKAESFAQKTSHISDGWVYLRKMSDNPKTSFCLAKDRLFELSLQNRLHEWLLEKIVAGSKTFERDEYGQGVIHLCATLGYRWAIYLFSCSGLSLDYRDKFGWTSLHWAAYYGREKIVAALLSAGAKPNLVTDPTSENPGGHTAADLASRNGYDGLAAYLAEKALVAQFNDMTLAGNVSGSLQTTTNDKVNSGNYTEEELVLKDTLAAYRTAADAAARIQTAFREHSLNVRKKTVEESHPEIEARNIIAAMKIQHAFRNYETRKKINAAGRIQYRFRTWKLRKDFLNKRRQAIKIQAYYRGHQVRRQHQKLVWSVGVLEKAVLRWRLKRKGFRGLEINPDSDTTLKDPNQDSDAEEDFFKDSRKQAEERVERSVVSVQAMFRSKQAQQDYRRIKLEHEQTKLAFEGFLHSDDDAEDM